MKLARQIAGFARFTLHGVRRRAWLVLFLLLAGCLMESLSLLTMIPVMHLIGLGMGAAGNDAATVALPFALRLSLGPILSVLVIMLFLQSVVARWRIILMTGTMQQATDRLRMALFAAIGNARWSRITALRGSDLNHALTADVDRVQVGIFSLLSLCQNIIMLTIYGLLAALVSWQMTIFALTVGFLLLAGLYPLRRSAARHGQTMAEALRDRQHIASEFIEGMKLARAYNGEAQYLNRLDAMLSALRLEMIRFARLSSNGTAAFQVGSSIAAASFVYVAYHYVALPLPRIVAMLLLFMRLAPRFNAVQESLQQIILTLPAYDNVRGLIERFQSDSADAIPRPVTPVPPLTRHIRLEHVSFAYDGKGSGPILDDVTVSIEAGGLTALVGPSGSGKSTIADLLMGLLEPSSGHISIDGVILSSGNRRNWRNQIAYVPQDVLLSHDTLASNLRMAEPEATEAQLWAALEAANANGFVAALPQGLDTIMGDRGCRLSGGERQRIALARALLKQPRLLILDEATSALDWDNQQMIGQTIDRLRGRMTILAIAHRSSLIASADHVIHLDNGRLAGASNMRSDDSDRWIRAAMAND